MSDFEDKLNGILSNPEAMAQIASLAQSLNLGGGGEAPGGGAPAEAQAPQLPQVQQAPQAPSGGGADLGGLAGLGSLLGKADPQLIGRLLPLLGELSGGDGGNERLQLLYALRPFLRPEKQDKVERAVKAARLIHVGKKLLSAMGDSYV